MTVADLPAAPPVETAPAEGIVPQQPIILPPVTQPAAQTSSPPPEATEAETEPAADTLPDVEIPCSCPCGCNGVRPCTCGYPCQSEYAIAVETTQLDFHSYAETLDPEQIWYAYQQLDRESTDLYPETNDGIRSE